VLDGKVGVVDLEDLDARTLGNVPHLIDEGGGNGQSQEIAPGSRGAAAQLGQIISDVAGRSPYP
jgi:hypothetical protein